MTQEAKPALEPAPRDRTGHALWKYAGIARMGDGEHPRDWMRFYQFVALAHSHRVGWDAGEVTHRLAKYGIARDRARYLAEIYWHARCVMYLRNHSWGPAADYYGWLGKRGTRIT
jgi:hypothetical protein